ncbi:MAG TPA: cytochrome c [Burkholderiales bacterium]|nr:cytochrome c [Burkholderiales bacterium]
MHLLNGPAAAGFLLLSALTLIAAPVAAQGDAKRGAYLAKAGGCFGCHTEDRKGATPFAGGRALKTPFGIFYGPNITPDPEVGLGRWTQAEFVNAMRRGVRPDGASLYPAFPYPSFTKITDADLHDLWAYLRTLAPSARPNRPHELHFPFGWRFLLRGWKWLFFRQGAFQPDPSHGALLERGAYLVQALGHCGECHTPRNLFGAPEKDRYLAGATLPGGGKASNLTPTRLKKWTDSELRDFLKSGMTPDGDVAAEAMDEVIRNTTSQLTSGDLEALIVYLRSLPPLPEAPK